MNAYRRWAGLAGLGLLVALLGILPARADEDQDGDAQLAKAVAELRAVLSALDARVLALETWQARVDDVLLVPQAPEPGTSAVPVPPEPDGEPQVHFDEDRFEGLRHYWTRTQITQVRNLRTTPPAVRMDVRFQTVKKSGLDPAHVMEVEVVHGGEPYTGHTRTILLIDDERLVLELAPASRHLGRAGLIATVWQWVLSPDELQALTSAKHVDVRLGGYEFVLGKGLRAAMAKTKRLMDKAVR